MARLGAQRIGCASRRLQGDGLRHGNLRGCRAARSCGLALAARAPTRAAAAGLAARSAAAAEPALARPLSPRAWLEERATAAAVAAAGDGRRIATAAAG